MAAPPDNACRLQSALRITKRRLRLVELLAAALLLAAVLLLELAALVLADHVLADGLGNPARRLGRWALAASTAALVLLTVLRPLSRRISDLHVARLLERAHPRFQNDLTAAVELARHGDTHPGVLAALRARAADDLADVDVRAAVPVRRLRWATAGLAAGLAGWLLLAALSPKSVLTSLARSLGSSRPAPTATRIRSFAPEADVAVLLGEPVVFEARIRRPAGPVRVALRGEPNLPEPPATEWVELAAGAAEGRAVRYARTWDSRSIGVGTRWFSLHAGDASTPPRRLEVLPVPAVMEVGLSVRWPAYTGRGEMPVPGRDVQALVGSELIVAAQTNVPAHRPRLVAEGGESIPMTIDPAEPTRIVATLPVTAAAQFRIVFEDSHGHASQAGVPYRLEAMEDAPPNVARHEPAETVTLAPDESLALEGQATDDLGLVEVAFEARRGPERSSEPIARFAAPGRTIAPVAGGVAAADLGRPGERLLCRLVARDLKPPQGQTGASEWFTVVIADRPAAPPAAPPRPPPAQQAVAEAALPDSQPSPGRGDEPALADGAGASPGQVEGAGALEPGQEQAQDAQIRQVVRELQQLAREDEALLRKLAEQLDRQAAGRPDEEAQGPNEGRPEPPTDAGPPPRPQPDQSAPAGGPMAAPADGATPAHAGDAGAPAEGQPAAPGQGQQPAPQSPAGSPAAGGASDGQPAADGQTSGQAPGEAPSEASGQAQGQAQGQGQAPSPSQTGQGHAAGQGSDAQTDSGSPRADGSPGKGSAGGGTGSSGEGSAGPGGPPAFTPDAPAEGQAAAPAPPDPLEQPLEGVGRIIDEAQRRRRADAAADALPRELGMTDPQFQAFLARYSERFDRLRALRAPGSDLERLEAPSALPGSLDVQRGSTEPGHLPAGTTAPEELKGLAAPLRQQVSQDYRRHVDDFFRAVSETPGEDKKEN